MKSNALIRSICCSIFFITLLHNKQVMGQGAIAITNGANNEVTITIKGNNNVLEIINDLNANQKNSEISQAITTPPPVVDNSTQPTDTPPTWTQKQKLLSALCLFLTTLIIYHCYINYVLHHLNGVLKNSERWYLWHYNEPIESLQANELVSAIYQRYNFSHTHDIPIFKQFLKDIAQEESQLNTYDKLHKHISIMLRIEQILLSPADYFVQWFWPLYNTGTVATAMRKLLHHCSIKHACVYDEEFASNISTHLKHLDNLRTLFLNWSLYTTRRIKKKICA
jgi:hypothetical protein